MIALLYQSTYHMLCTLIDYHFNTPILFAQTESIFIFILYLYNIYIFILKIYMHIYCYISFLYNYYNMFQAFEENLYRIYIIEKNRC